MANQISGRIYRIDPVNQIQTKSGETISKTSLFLNTCTFDRYTGAKNYSEYFVKLDVMGQACDQLTKFNINDEVIVDFELSPSKFFKTNDGKDDIITHPRMISLRLLNAQPEPQSAPTQPQPQAQAPQMYKDPVSGRLFYYDQTGNVVWC